MSKPPLMAITLHRPWAEAIASYGKDIENRSWGCPLPVGSYLAIHAGKQWDDSGAIWINQEFGYEPDQSSPTGIIAIARFAGNVTESNSPWFVGEIGWKLEEIISFPAAPCRGYQRLWRVPDSLLPSVRQAYAFAKEGRSHLTVS